MNTGTPRRLAAPDRRRALALLGITRWERRVRGDLSPVATDGRGDAVPAMAPPAARTAPPEAMADARAERAQLARLTRPPVAPRAAAVMRPTQARTRLAVQVPVDAGAAPLAGPYRLVLLQILRAVDVLPMDVAFNPTGDDELPELVLGGAPRRDDALLGPPLPMLRANPKAKRNLWPMLRRLARRLRR